MKEQQDYVKDLVKIRSMMERSSKFLSLSGWAGILAGIYALSATFIVYKFYHFNTDKILYDTASLRNLSPHLSKVIILAVLTLIIALGTAIFLSYKKAKKRNEKAWNATSRRLLANMAVPLVSGGILILILISKNMLGLIAPTTLLFYGMALYNAGKFTFDEVKFMGMVQIALGLLSSYFIEYGLLFWALGFGVVHIVYGIYMQFRYER